MQRSGVTTENLKTFLNHCELEELADEVEPTDSIPTVLRKVKSGGHWNFFNYELVADMIHTYCQNTHVIADLERYIYKFDVYSQRKVSEVPYRLIRDSHSDSQSVSILKVKLDDKYTISRINLGQVKQIQQKIGEVLNKRPLLLMDVWYGCVELTFRYFHEISPLSEEQRLQLAEIGVKWWECDGHKVCLKPDKVTRKEDSNLSQSVRNTIHEVRLSKKSFRQYLGFYIKKGTVAPHASEKTPPGVVVSHLVPGGLAENCGLLTAGDEILQVNGISVAGKSLEQVTDIIIANEENLILTVAPHSLSNS